MENNTNEMLGINEPNAPTHEKKGDSSAEETLTFVAKFILVVGIISTVIMLFTITTTTTTTTIEGIYRSKDTTTINPTGVILTIATLVSSVITWGLLRVISNISTSLKEINSKTK